MAGLARDGAKDKALIFLALVNLSFYTNYMLFCRTSKLPSQHAAEGVICIDMRGVRLINTKEKKGSYKAGVES
jgi:hypothetical protein